MRCTPAARLGTAGRLPTRGPMSKLRSAALLLLAALGGCTPVSLRFEPARPLNLVLDVSAEVPDRESVHREVDAQLRAELGALLAPPASPGAADLRLEIRGLEPDRMGFLARYGGVGLMGITLAAAQGRGWDGLATAVLGTAAGGAWIVTSLTRGILRSNEEDRLGYPPLRFQGRLSNGEAQLELAQLGLRKLHRPLPPEAARDPLQVRREAIHALAQGVARAVRPRDR